MFFLPKGGSMGLNQLKKLRSFGMWENVAEENDVLLSRLVLFFFFGCGPSVRRKS